MRAGPQQLFPGASRGNPRAPRAFPRLTNARTFDMGIDAHRENEDELRSRRSQKTGAAAGGDEKSPEARPKSRRKPRESATPPVKPEPPARD